jgi:hypothetical protein
MAVQREDPYVLPAADAPQCAVLGCVAPVVAEVFDGDYCEALELFRGRHRKMLRTRRAGDERLFTCQHHRETDPRMRRLHWQDLLF